MRKAIQLFLLCMLLAVSAAAQSFTTVSGTVTDPLGFAYAYGTITPHLSISGTARWTSSGISYYPPNQPVQLDASGSFSMNLGQNGALTPGSSTWGFTVCSAAGSVQPSIGTGSQCFDVTGITASGSTQSISAQLQGSAALITKVGQSTIYVDVRQYGLKGDGTTDNTAAFNAMIADACAKNRTWIVFPAGQFRFASKPNPLGCGLRLMGSSDGSTNTGGTQILSDYTESTASNGFFVWDGSSGTAIGTGGGLSYMTINKTTAHTGGEAIKLTGADDNHRSGFFTIGPGVIVTGLGTGSWNKGLGIDGSCCTTSGSQGIRDINIYGLYVANATDSGDVVDFNNAVHVFWYGGNVFAASNGAADSGVTVTGNGSGTQASTQINLDGMEVLGTVTFDQVSTARFSGFANNFTSTANAATCTVVADIATTISNLAPCILVGSNSAGSTLGSVTLTGGLTVTGTNLTTLGLTVVGSLPAAASFPRVMIWVTDSTAVAAEGQTCVGGSTTKALAISDGSAWKCF